MIVSKCPLRISLVGGSTDLDEFIQRFGRGSVISFPSNLFCYVSIHENNRGKFILNYSKKEEVDTIDEIKNDVARTVLTHFGVDKPITVSFNTDILTDGSGLASSSAYTIALIKAICIYKHHHLSEFEIAKLAIDLERQFNPLTGYQDSYGCAIGGFKRIDFLKDKRPSFTYFDNEFINKHYSMFLIHTGIKRSSTDILKSIDVEKCLPLLDLVEKTENAILQGDYQRFEELLNESWEKKKKTSSLIADSSELKKLDDLLSELRTAGIVRSLKLCGAGGGGYFLVFVTKDKTNDFMSCVSIEKDRMQSVISIGINDYGVIGKKI